MKKISYILIILFFLLSLENILAQEMNHSPAAIEKMKLDQLWHKTDNAAGIFFDGTENYTSLNMSYNSINGNFHRPQQGKNENIWGFDAEGGVKLDKMYLWGEFRYSRNAIKDANYNASIIDPFRGMPYFVADTNISNWNNQHYELAFKACMPHVTNHLSAGIAGGYKASLGAKQRDPRTENYLMKLELKPSIVYSPSTSHHIGLNLVYYSLKEESNMENINTDISQTYYELYGLGTAVIGLGSGRTTNYVGNNIGGGIQYNYTGNVNVLFSSDYSLKVEEVEISFTTPKDDSATKQTLWKNNLYLHTTAKDHSHYLNVEYAKRHIDGIQYITLRDVSETYKGWISLHKNIRSTYKDQFLQIGYDYTKNAQNEYKWLAGIQMGIKEKKDVYLIPRSEKKIKNAFGEIHGKYNCNLSDKLAKRLLMGISFAYNKNLSGHYLYGGSHPEYPIVTELEQGDFDYLSSDFYALNVSATYSQRIKKENKINFFIKANGIFAKGQNTYFNDRNNLLFTLGCNF